MITNERQYKITKQQLLKLNRALKDFNSEKVEERVSSKILADAEQNALKSEIEILTDQLREYELLRSGKIARLEATNLGDLPRILIRARIAQGFTQRELAKRVGLKEQQIQRYESEEYAKANLQRLQVIAEALNLSIAEIAEFNTTLSIKESSDAGELDWSKFPIKEMYLRQWFKGFSGSLAAAMNDAENLVSSFVKSAISRPAVALHRKQIRSDSSIDEYALLAWECRILTLASETHLGSSYQEGVIDDSWVAELAKESAKKDGPLRAREKLAQEAGIALIIEPHLTHTHLDGAALLSKRGPIIGMTLRYDRIDHFWFVLFHELIHVLKHLRKGKIESIFDDLEASDTKKVEHEADSLAAEVLLPREIWHKSLAKYVRSLGTIKALAAELSISPAIVAGRIRHEANNYVILNDLVGHGEVRKLFPDAAFGR
ncbi:MAG: helix-turn-helix domain-containing protein [bacterium]